MTQLRELLAPAAAIVSIAIAYATLKFKVAKNQRDITGVSIREAANTRQAHRLFILGLASEIDAAAGDPLEVKRLTEMLRKAVE